MTFAKWCSAGLITLLVTFMAMPAAAEPPSARDFAMKKTAGLLELGPEGRSLALLTRQYQLICRDDRFERQDPDRCKPDERYLAPTDRILIVDVKTMTQQMAIPIPDDYTVHWMEWTAPNNLLVSFTTGWSFSRRSYQFRQDA